MSNLSLSELRPVGASRNHAVRRSVVDSVMKPHRTRGESKYMLEEIYFSDLCGDIENKDANGEIIGINPQKAWYDNGKYRFQFPSLWYQSACNNKAIGLRNIELSPDAVKFRLQVKFYERGSTESEYVQIGDTKYLLLQFLPHTSLMEIMSEVASKMQTRVDADEVLKGKGIFIYWSYNYRDASAAFELCTYRYPDKDRIVFEIYADDMREYWKTECGFWECFNTNEDYMTGKRRVYEFKNVWNRKDIFVHASFVNGTSFQFLGKNGEFYTKPSKMYRFNGNSPDFYFELSYDGIHPVQHKFARFIVQLAYIYNDADYMAE